MSRAAFSDIDLEDFQACDSHPASPIRDISSRFNPCDQRRAMRRQFRCQRSRANGIQLLSLGSRRFRRRAGGVQIRVASIRERFCPSDAYAAGPRDSRSRRNASMELYFETMAIAATKYNFDPVGDGSTIVNPVSSSASVVENGPVRKRIKLSMSFEVRLRWRPDRRARSSDLRATRNCSYCDAPRRARPRRFHRRRYDRARDHRDPRCNCAAVVASDAVHDTSFGVIRRPLAPSEPRGTEDIYPTVPHRSFTAVEGSEFSVALASRGILEVEARPEPAGATTILLDAAAMRRVAFAFRPRDAPRRCRTRARDARRAGVGRASLRIRSRDFQRAAILSATCCNGSKRTPRRADIFRPPRRSRRRRLPCAELQNLA